MPLPYSKGWTSPTTTSLATDVDTPVPDAHTRLSAKQIRERERQIAAPLLRDSSEDVDNSPIRVETTWNHKQGRFLESTNRLLDFEGSLRCGKTKALVWKMINYCQNFPGIKCYLSRFTQDSLDAQLKPKFYEECPPSLLKRDGWHSDQEYQEFDNGSWLYLRSLKPSDDKMRFVKTAGLTLAVIGVDQPEELPEDIGKNLIGRISQPGFPQQLIFTPNPPNNDHWIAKMFPEDGRDPITKELIPDQEYICSSVYDNAHILGELYIRSLERLYPAGGALHRRNVLGRRGLALAGEPVYGKVFRRLIHAARAYWPKILDNIPLVESWDFGHKHPAVSWTQFPGWGAMHVLLELMGDNIYLEEFIPEVAALRKQMFGSDPFLWQCCDPAGADGNSNGRRGTAIESLNEAGIYPTFLAGSNHPKMRVRSIQRMASYMGRLTSRGPAFSIHQDRCPIICDAFEGGYVYPEKPRRLMNMPNLRVPHKDGYYEHLMNTLEYAVLNFGADVVIDDPGSPAAMLLDMLPGPNVGRPTSERARLYRQARGDSDPDDSADVNYIRGRLGSIRSSSRSGY